MTQSFWSDSAPDYKKRGEMYASVEFNKRGKAKYIRLAKNQTRRGEFRVEGSTAIYEPNNILTLPQAGKDEREFVENLPFIKNVKMEESDEDCCPDCGEKALSPPPQVLTSPPVYECPECGWRGKL